MKIGGVLSEAWSLYQRFLGRFFMTALAVFVVLDLFSALADRATGDNTGANVFWFLLGALISVVGYFWVQAALVETVNDVRDGRADRSIGETYGAVRPRLAAATIAGVLAAIGIGIGLILLVVPGNGWSVFGLVIITFLVVAIASTIIRLLFSPLPNFLDVWLGSLVAHSLTVPFAAAALTTAYFKLVARTEPASAAPLAAP